MQEYSDDEFVSADEYLSEAETFQTPTKKDLVGRLLWLRGPLKKYSSRGLDIRAADHAFLVVDYQPQDITRKATLLVCMINSFAYTPPKIEAIRRDPRYVPIWGNKASLCSNPPMVFLQNIANELPSPSWVNISTVYHIELACFNLDKTGIWGTSRMRPECIASLQESIRKALRASSGQSTRNAGSAIAAVQQVHVGNVRMQNNISSQATSSNEAKMRVREQSCFLYIRTVEIDPEGKKNVPFQRQLDDPDYDPLDETDM